MEKKKTKTNIKPLNFQSRELKIHEHVLKYGKKSRDELCNTMWWPKDMNLLSKKSTKIFIKKK